MEGLSSSTAAIRNNRGDWLSRSKSGILVKALVAFVAASLVAATLIVAVPYVTKSLNKQSTAMASTYHNTVKNGTIGKNIVMRLILFKYFRTSKSGRNAQIVRL